ncbi:unnamed protein product [Penicillium camemberti]|uniref:Str. FM013 n=1 Tax=Penicillium camemberti (strain FM 013) TaxID=1429867 RepID=A0A0G4NUX5_PENC3|nr:unnamed protein product [Penicillium camemberti]
MIFCAGGYDQHPKVLSPIPFILLLAAWRKLGTVCQVLAVQFVALKVPGRGQTAQPYDGAPLPPPAKAPGIGIMWLAFMTSLKQKSGWGQGHPDLARQPQNLTKTIDSLFRESLQVVPYFLQEIDGAHLVYGAAAFVVCPTAVFACSSEPPGTVV